MAPARRAFRGALAHRRPRVRCRGMHLGQSGRSVANMTLATARARGQERVNRWAEATFPSEEASRGNRNECGQVLAMTASLIALGAVVGIAVDTGFFFTYRRAMQTAVDAAALTGAEQAWRGTAHGLKADSSCGLGTCQPGDLSCQVAFAGRYAACKDGLDNAAVPPAVRGRSTGSSILLDARVVM